MSSKRRTSNKSKRDYYVHCGGYNVTPTLIETKCRNDPFTTFPGRKNLPWKLRRRTAKGIQELQILANKYGEGKLRATMRKIIELVEREESWCQK